MQTRINLTPTRNHRVKSDYGTFDFYKSYKRKFPESNIEESSYRRVLRELNSQIRDKIATIPYDFKIPNRLGTIRVIKYYPEYIVDKDGVVKNKLGIDFKETLNLWNEDEDARERKIMVYYENEHSDGFIFKIKYDKKVARYRNKSFYMFKPNRQMKSILSKNIINKQIDAFLS